MELSSTEIAAALKKAHELREDNKLLTEALSRAKAEATKQRTLREKGENGQYVTKRIYSQLVAHKNELAAENESLKVQFDWITGVVRAAIADLGAHNGAGAIERLRGVFDHE